MHLQLQTFRFVFKAADTFDFAPGRAANLLRGAFGDIFRKLACRPGCLSAASCPYRASCPYAQMFEPGGVQPSPSGLRDWPRPFVFRAAHLDGTSVEAGSQFYFDLHLFNLQTDAYRWLILAFAQLGREGLGRGRKSLELLRVESVAADDSVVNLLYEGAGFCAGAVPASITLPLQAEATNATRLSVRFVTPTELKSASRIAPTLEFAILAARVRDRISTLCELYGDGAPNLNFSGYGERAALVRMTSSAIHPVQAARRSSRTGQVHSIGGFVGTAEYAGDVSEFLPWLHAARWTGVGRQTVWGKGMIETAAY